MEPWIAWIEPLNARAGMTLGVVTTCQDGHRVYPANPRQRVRCCPGCGQQARRR